MHSLNSIVVQHAKRSWVDLSSLFAMTKITHISTYWDILIASTLKEAFSVEVRWQRFGVGSKIVQSDGAYIVNTCVPNLINQKDRHTAVMQAVTVANFMPWGGIQLGHACEIDATTGQPCCKCMDDVVAKLRRVICVIAFCRSSEHTMRGSLADVRLHGRLVVIVRDVSSAFDSGLAHVMARRHQQAWFG